MPTPRPSIIATTPVISGTATMPDMMPMALLPTTMAVRAATIGRLIATSEPKAIARMTTAIRMPIISLLPPAGDLRVAEATVVLDLDARVTEALDGLLGGVELGEPDLLGVEADRRERGLPIGADGRAARVVGAATPRSTCGPSASLSTACSTAARVAGDGEALLGVEDDVRGVQRLLREAVLDGVGGALRLGPGQAEALVVATAVGGVEHEDRAGEEDPGADDPPRVAAGEVADPVEEVRHGGPF